MSDAVHQRIKEIVTGDKVVLFMKGRRMFPQCGFSSTVVQILDQMVDNYKTVNVLSDPDIREGVKSYSDWPTIPQLYVDGEFVGGCDIIKEMFASGELHSAMGVSDDAPTETPEIVVTDSAKEAVVQAREDENTVLRLMVSPRFEHGMEFGTIGERDIVVESNGLKLAMDRATAKRAMGLKVDYVADESGTGFKIDNPNAPTQVRDIDVQQLKDKLDAGSIELFDVRGEDERARAKIAQARALDAEGAAHLQSLAKDTPIYFMCHSGGRSSQAAQQFAAEGYTEVYNVMGGIDAWAQHIDTSVPRY